MIRRTSRPSYLSPRLVPALTVPLDHDYGDEATMVANFLTVPYPGLRQSAAIALLRLALTRGDCRPVVREDAVAVCMAAIATTTRADDLEACGTLAHLTCRAFARLQVGDPSGPLEQQTLVAIAEAAAAVLYAEVE